MAVKCLTSEQIQSVRLADNQFSVDGIRSTTICNVIPPAELQNLDLTQNSNERYNTPLRTVEVVAMSTNELQLEVDYECDWPPDRQ